MKKIITLLLVLGMIVSTMPVTAFAGRTVPPSYEERIQRSTLKNQEQDNGRSVYERPIVDTTKVSVSENEGALNGNSSTKPSRPVVDLTKSSYSDSNASGVEQTKADNINEVASGFSARNIKSPEGYIPLYEDYEVAGIIGSAYPIKRIVVAVVSQSDWEEVAFEVVAEPWSETVDIADYNDKTSFDSLAEGWYMYIVRVTDEKNMSYIGAQSYFSVVNVPIALNDDNLYFKQTGKYCTLDAMAMVFRRKAVIDGNNNWNVITEDSMKTQGNWIGGLSGSPKYVDELNGISMKATSKRLYKSSTLNANTAQIVSTLKEYLDKHPEGIVLYVFEYNSAWQHAVTLTHYDEQGNFYCVDPNGDTTGIINLMDSTLVDKWHADTLTLEGLLKYCVKIWWVNSANNV